MSITGSDHEKEATDDDPRRCKAVPTPNKLLLKVIAPVVVEIGWWIYTLTDPLANLGRFVEKTPYRGQPNYFMSITMVFGSLVAGATSEGGGAVAFPVMTLLLGIPPALARDFSLFIQSFGMTCASISILGLGVPVDLMALLWSSLGGVLGMIFGLAFVAENLPPPYAKMLFVSLWMVFAVALWILNSMRTDRTVHFSVIKSNEALTRHKADTNQGESDSILFLKRKSQLILFLTGSIGGIISSVSGSGLDMATFSILVLYFRVSEKVATPTSVILMAINAVVGTILRSLSLGGQLVQQQNKTAWNFVYVCVPIVVIGAPLGAQISSKLSRFTIAKLLYILDICQFAVALAVIQPWSAPNAVGLCLASAGALVGGSLFFWKTADWGKSRDIKADEDTETESKTESVDC